MINELTKFTKWLMTWILKLSIYIFTGYIGITGIVSGGVDASAIKATKLAVSGCVPVVGSIISDASEAILASASLMKSATGVYGIWATICLLIGPFLKIGIHYTLLKLTGGVCGIFGDGHCVTLIRSFVTVMGYVLAVIGTVSIILLISVVCFMKGVS